MAVLRHDAQVRLPADFGLGLAVTAFLGGLVLLALVAVASVPSQGPRAESRQPDLGTTYFDHAAPAAAVSPVATH